MGGCLAPLYTIYSKHLWPLPGFPLCRTQQALYRWLFGGCVLSQCVLVGVGAPLHVALQLSPLHGRCNVKEPLQEEQPPLLPLSYTPSRVDFAQFIQVDLPSQSSVSDPLHASSSFGELLHPLTQGGQTVIL